MYFPCRGGVRGGADQFNWEDIKTDKFRENYLGHSLKAPVGRWQKGKDLTWYSKDKSGASQRESMLALKKAEEEAMLAALGRKTLKKEAGQITKEELSEVLKRGQSERSGLDVERVEGMGYSDARGSRPLKEGLSFHKVPGADECAAPSFSETLKSDYVKEDKNNRAASSERTDNGSDEGKSSRRAAERRKRRHDSSDSSSEDDARRSYTSKKLQTDSSSKQKRTDSRNSKETERSHSKHKSSKQHDSKRKDDKVRHKSSKKKKRKEKVRKRRHDSGSDS